MCNTKKIYMASFLILCVIFVFPVISSAITIKVGNFSEELGLVLPEGGMIDLKSMPDKFKARVDGAAKLSSLGMRNIEEGDTLEVYYLKNNLWGIIHPSGGKLKIRVSFKDYNRLQTSK